MSTTLRWIPATPAEELRGLPVALKFALREVFGYPIDTQFSTTDARSMGILDTLVALKVEGAKQLRESVEKHDTVDVWEE